MTIYNRAEQYKEKVISKLQERSGTPNRYSSNASNKRAATEGAEVNRFYQPSPLRLQQFLTEEKQDIDRERERLNKLAENMNKIPPSKAHIPGLTSSMQKSLERPRQGRESAHI